jgi:16S rRNA (guanine(966)-N(2))-methyltransferase RsmD
MRIIAGSQKGRRLLSGPGRNLRPTSGRVKEALFSILGERVVGASLLDLFAGTGAIGLEALSRGATHVTFVESDASTLRILRANLERCRLDVETEIRSCPASTFLRERRDRPFDIVFVDPPYRQDSAADVLPSLERSVMIAPGSLVILEHPTKRAIPSQIGRLDRMRQYRYGDTSLSLFEVRADGTAS